MGENRRAAHSDPDLEGPWRNLERGGLAVEDPLEAAVEPAPAIGPGPGDPGEAGLRHLALEGLGPHDRRLGRAHRDAPAGERRLEESLRLLAELFLIRALFGAHAGTAATCREPPTAR